MKIKKIVVFGCGSAGANTLINLIAAYPDLRFCAVDYDIVEQRNLITQPYDRADLKRPKTQALQKIIYQKFNKKIEIINKKITNKSELLTFDENTLLIDAFDNVPSRNLFVKLISPVVHIGFSVSLTGEICWDESWTLMKESKSDSAVDVCILNNSKSFIQALTGTAALAISKFIEKQEKINIYFDSYLNFKIF